MSDSSIFAVARSIQDMAQQKRVENILELASMYNAKGNRRLAESYMTRAGEELGLNT